ncbi:hypothetical protein ACGFJT_41690 [Actinomadura geliboluensis]|uniref:hypothetical protein n=1 Tax=Actinomadura geliboluensis TaxID=882440 RepID=UPI003724B665
MDNRELDEALAQAHEQLLADLLQVITPARVETGKRKVLAAGGPPDDGAEMVY